MRTIKDLLTILVLTLLFSLAMTAQTVLQTLDGKSIDLQRQDGKVVVLAVGAAWLRLSNKQADFTNTLAKKYADKNVVVYFVATDSVSTGSKNFMSNDDIRKFGITNKLTVPVLRDPDGTLMMKKFGIDQFPSFVILDKKGNRAGEPFGGIDPKYDVTIPISKVVDRLVS